MQLFRKHSSTSNILRLRVRSSTGQGFTGLLFSATGLIVSTICDNEAAPTVYTSAGSTTETITTLGTYAAPTATKCRLKLIDDTNDPGDIELQLADARFSVAGAKELRIFVSGVSGMLGKEILIQLDPAPADVTHAAGTAWNSGAITAASIASNAINSAKVAAGAVHADAIASDAITAAKIAAGAIDTATFAAGTTIPRVTLADTLTTYTGNTPQTGDAFARIGLAGAGLTAVPWNAAWDAEAQSEATDALNAYDPPTNAEMEARTLVAANYATAAALTTAQGTLTKLDGMLVLDGAVYQLTANALEFGPGGDTNNISVEITDTQGVAS